MRIRYPNAVGGCLLHALVVAGVVWVCSEDIFQSFRFPSWFPWVTLLLVLLPWPAWGFVLWKAAKVRRARAVVTPMLVGVVIMHQVVLFLIGAFLFLLGYEPFR
jgi:hypothetical protein